MRNQYIFKKSSEDWYDPKYPDDIVAPCYFYEWTVYVQDTYDFTKQGGEIEEALEWVDAASAEPRKGQDKKYLGFFLEENVQADVAFNMGDQKRYLGLDKVHWSYDGLQYKESVFIHSDWTFELDGAEFKVPKRFIKALELWKNFKENK